MLVDVLGDVGSPASAAEHVHRAVHTVSDHVEPAIDVLEGVRSAMNTLAVARFQRDDYQLDLLAEDVSDVCEHPAVHLEEFGEQRPDILKGWSPKGGWPPRRGGRAPVGGAGRRPVRCPTGGA